MRKIILFVCVVVVFCYSCNNSAPTTITKTDSVVVTVVVDTVRERFLLDSVLKQFETPSQYLKASAIHPAKVTGSKGTIISIFPDDLMTLSGKPLGNHIDIELKELTTSEEFARNRAATVSDLKLLVSGGAYYIHMTTGGDTLKLKPGKALNVQFPILDKENMFLFYGKKDITGQMNWRPSGQDLKVIEGYLPDPRKEGEREVKTNEKPSSVYNEILVENLDWINCDYFASSENLTQLSVDIDKSDSFVYVASYVIFKDVNSVMTSFERVSGTINKIYGVPVGANVAFVAIATKNNKLYAYKSELKVTEGQMLHIKLKETPASDVANLFKI